MGLTRSFYSLSIVTATHCPGYYLTHSFSFSDPIVIFVSSETHYKTALINDPQSTASDEKDRKTTYKLHKTEAQAQSQTESGTQRQKKEAQVNRSKDNTHKKSLSAHQKVPHSFTLTLNITPKHSTLRFPNRLVTLSLSQSDLALSITDQTSGRKSEKEKCEGEKVIFFLLVCGILGLVMKPFVDYEKEIPLMLNHVIAENQVCIRILKCDCY